MRGWLDGCVWRPAGNRCKAGSKRPATRAAAHLVGGRRQRLGGQKQLQRGFILPALSKQVKAPLHGLLGAGWGCGGAARAGRGSQKHRPPLWDRALWSPDAAAGCARPCKRLLWPARARELRLERRKHGCARLGLLDVRREARIGRGECGQLMAMGEVAVVPRWTERFHWTRFPALSASRRESVAFPADEASSKRVQASQAPASNGSCARPPASLPPRTA